jgi:hypothetical protein
VTQRGQATRVFGRYGCRDDLDQHVLDSCCKLPDQFEVADWYTTPNRFLEELNNLGFNDGKSIHESRWQIDNIPAIRMSDYGKRKRLWETPTTYVQDNGHMLGKLLQQMRGGTSIPDQFLEELNELGYNDGRSIHESKWQIDYMPTIRESDYGREKRLRDMPTTKGTIGHILRDLRRRYEKSRVSAEIYAELNALGAELPTTSE